jgi:hypothetical protein
MNIYTHAQNKDILVYSLTLSNEIWLSALLVGKTALQWTQGDGFIGRLIDEIQSLGISVRNINDLNDIISLRI